GLLRNCFQRQRQIPHHDPASMRNALLKIFNRGRQSPKSSTSRCQKTDRRHSPWEGGFHRPMLELLETRLCPSTTISLGTDLSFQIAGNFELSGTVNSHIATATDPVLISLYKSGGGFQATLEISSGTFSADTSTTSNPNEEF